VAEKGLGVALGKPSRLRGRRHRHPRHTEGLELEKLEIEGTGEFNYGRYVVAAEEKDPGYQEVEYVVRIKSEERL